MNRSTRVLIGVGALVFVAIVVSAAFAPSGGTATKTRATTTTTTVVRHRAPKSTHKSTTTTSSTSTSTTTTPVPPSGMTADEVRSYCASLESMSQQQGFDSSQIRCGLASDFPAAGTPAATTTTVAGAPAATTTTVAGTPVAPPPVDPDNANDQRGATAFSKVTIKTREQLCAFIHADTQESHGVVGRAMAVLKDQPDEFQRWYNCEGFVPLQYTVPVDILGTTMFADNQVIDLTKARRAGSQDMFWFFFTSKGELVKMASLRAACGNVSIVKIIPVKPKSTAPSISEAPKQKEIPSKCYLADMLHQVCGSPDKGPELILPGSDGRGATSGYTSGGAETTETSQPHGSTSLTPTPSGSQTDGAQPPSGVDVITNPPAASQPPSGGDTGGSQTVTNPGSGFDPGHNPTQGTGSGSQPGTDPGSPP